eukprot:scaffold21197_cov22-Tisochrysis_lutea.AAC.4
MGGAASWDKERRQCKQTLVGLQTGVQSHKKKAVSHIERAAHIGSDGRGGCSGTGYRVEKASVKGVGCSGTRVRGCFFVLVRVGAMFAAALVVCVFGHGGQMAALS